MKENSREEDIKILENYIYNKKETMKEQLVKAIEHLIKAYKELEEENEKKDDELIYVTGQNFEELKELYIPVSLVEEKIEERKLWLSSNNIGYKDDYVLEVLQELLEKR